MKKLSTHVPLGGSYRHLGASKLTVLIFGSLAAFVLYCGYHTLPMFYAYYELENQAIGMARRASIITNDEIKKRLLSEIKRYDIPADPEDLEIERGDGTMKISIAYSDTLFFPWFDRDIELHTFQFQLYVEENISDERQRY